MAVLDTDLEYRLRKGYEIIDNLPEDQKIFVKAVLENKDQFIQKQRKTIEDQQAVFDGIHRFSNYYR